MTDDRLDGDGERSKDGDSDSSEAVLARLIETAHAVVDDESPPLVRITQLHAAMRGVLPDAQGISELSADDQRFVTVVLLLSGTAQAVAELELSVADMRTRLERVLRSKR